MERKKNRKSLSKKVMTCNYPRRLEAKKAMYTLIWKKTKKERDELLLNKK
tara:strand:- start:220 stop:369 length:150 start_codon:yes stop_codon:yes gene_type:complete